MPIGCCALLEEHEPIIKRTVLRHVIEGKMVLPMAKRLIVIVNELPSGDWLAVKGLNG
jgi:hypothetical protein